MAKKTKKEKIIADYRRKIKLLNQISVQNIQKEYPKDNKKNPLLKEKSHNYSNKFSDYNFINYFKSDFKKSLIISFFIFALELLTYFAMLKVKFD